jgi:hypothetical protein
MDDDIFAMEGVGNTQPEESDHDSDSGSMASDSSLSEQEMQTNFPVINASRIIFFISKC